jgi:hypothetical protein
VAELSLDDDQRHAFVSHLDSVGVAQLMRGKARRTPAARCCPAELGARGCA